MTLSEPPEDAPLSGQSQTAIESQAEAEAAPATTDAAHQVPHRTHMGHALSQHDLQHVVPKVDMGSVDKSVFLEEILKSRRELHIARQQFEQVSDPLLIDHAVYRMGAAERHLNYLFKLAQQYGMSFDGMQWEWTAEEWKID